ncbi:hypothetical protein RMAECT_1269 [Rickettsia rhipicephali str. Ect]|uniref:Uncharacterized protein n=1 Tax=Rickettsia rhipicephali str. Ect TaxID=1359199 RepID=A0A0F3PCY9_RICRH|nr:hypothetical protein RMAECT_1269 [Rickettsia rhipicephali str. Ect]
MWCKFIIASYFLVASNISEKELRIAKSSIFANCLIISGWKFRFYK